MDIREFGMMMTKELKNALGDKYVVEYKDVTKNNGVVYHALLIKMVSEPIAPTIYLDYFFDRYNEGMELEKLIKELISFYKKSCPPKSLDVQFFSDFSKVCRLLSFKVLNYERNKKILADLPYKKVEDLALVPICLLENEQIGNGTITITNKHLGIWEVSFDELWENALWNAEIVSPGLVENLADIVGDSMGMFSYDASLLPKNMFVVSNSSKTHGASAIFYPQMGKKLAKIMEGDFIILPSSVHETIVLPMDGFYGDPEFLTFMVKQVNSTTLQDEEILSDNVYYYDSEKDKIRLLPVRSDKV